MKHLSPTSKLLETWLIIVFAILLVGLPFSTHAQDGATRQAAPPPTSTAIKDLISQLNLSPEQLSQIQAIARDQREQRQNATRRVVQAEQALDDAIYVDNPDETVIAARAKELAEARGDNIRLNAVREARIRKILTPDQVRTFLILRDQALRNQRENRREQRANQSANTPVIRGGNALTPKRPNKQSNSTTTQPPQTNPKP